jgi:uncharacterized protein YjiS (DUF1127 family)
MTMSTVTTTITSLAMAAQALRGAGVAVLASLGRYLRHAIAAAIIERERRAAVEALRHLGDRELKDIGLCRGDIDAALAETASERVLRLSCLQQWRL